MRLAQFIDENGKRALAVTARGESRLVKGARTTLDLVRQAIAEAVSLRKLISDRGVGKPVDGRAAALRVARLAVVGMTTTLDSRTLIDAGAILTVSDFTDRRIVALIEGRIGADADERITG